ncbi:MAG: aminotransferase class I/II-fold pyridoxal phosphate-dependent enzyme [Candidatus Saccharibacteria bacterium]|nr:aminotransferase class I/II-fold pyridoxal phosphate-dependent enzyme [Candidatus Saccharibacteria bacterium]
MPKHFFLGQASHFTARERLNRLFTIGTKKSQRELCDLLIKRYGGDKDHVALTKNGRTALAIALKTALEPGSKVVVNGFTCYAVLEALQAAKMTPVFADVNPETLHYDDKILGDLLKKHKDIKGIIIQNTLGMPVDIEKIEKLTAKNQIKIFEDMAHCTGVHYQDGREVGTVGVAAALSFGKEKSLDAAAGGAVIIRDINLPAIKAPTKRSRFADTFRARLYPSFCAIYRALARVKLETLWMGFLIKTHQVERSANNKLDFNRRPPRFVAKIILGQFRWLPKDRKPIRKFVYVKNRDDLLAKLKRKGYHFDGFWFETPIAPERFYKKAHFDEAACPNATRVAKEIINLPTHYDEAKLKPALKIIEEYKK